MNIADHPSEDLSVCQANIVDIFMHASHMITYTSLHLSGQVISLYLTDNRENIKIKKHNVQDLPTTVLKNKS